MDFYTAQEVERIAAAMSDRYRVLVYVLAYAGLRFGEAAALRRGKCELSRSRLRIDEPVSEVAGELHFGPTKTHQHRFVVLPPFLLHMLNAHLEDCVARSNEALVFTSPDGAPLRYSTFRRRYWHRVLRCADLPQTGLHALRHTCASLLITEGAPIKAMQAQLGHRSAELTLDRYGHLYPDQMDVLAGHLELVRQRATGEAT